MTGISRTRSAGAKVTEQEYTQLEALAQTRGLTLGEWCRDVLLAQLRPSVVSLPEETILAEVLGLRMITINLLRALGNEETLTPEKVQKLSSGPTRRSSRQPWSVCVTMKRGETPSRLRPFLSAVLLICPPSEPLPTGQTERAVAPFE